MKVTLTFTVEEINIILQGLGELPAKTSMILIQKVHAESNNQVNGSKQETPVNNNQLNQN
jgi:hypothetical protein